VKGASAFQDSPCEVITLPVKLPHHPVVLEEQARRASDIQLRIADWITTFAGSMNFVYLHVVLFMVWMLFFEPYRRLIDHRTQQQK
jgi:hypothetical protein